LSSKLIINFVLDFQHFSKNIKFTLKQHKTYFKKEKKKSRIFSNFE